MILFDVLPLCWIYYNLFAKIVFFFFSNLYLNVVIDDATCAQRLWEMKGRGETNFYLCEINRNMVIDATKKGNKSRYINHSCNPNTQMQTWFVSCHLYCLCFCSSKVIIWSCFACYQDNWGWDKNRHFCHLWHK